MLNQEKCWEAVTHRDRQYDGKFLFGVITTGVYCRPGCPARQPLRDNVRFYATAQEAERDGLRACKRCRPLETQDRKIQEVCRYIEQHEGTPDLAELAALAGLSRFHLQRSFKAAVGVTPKQYGDAFRIGRLKQTLRQSRDVAGAVYDAGFGSSSRVYEQSDEQLGMTPNQYRRGGQGVAITYAMSQSPAGLMMIGATDRGLCFLQFADSERELLESLRREYPAAELQPMGRPTAEFRQWIDVLSKHLTGAQPRMELPLDIRATAFQMRVWNYLQTIPYGETRSYTEVAQGIGHPSAVRAVARACATNKVALVIPCHRVIRGTGDLGGYRWGLSRKQALLEREGLSEVS